MRALIIGIGGQDGAYLARLLISKGYEVVGTSRVATLANQANLLRLGIQHRVRIVPMSLKDPSSVQAVLASVQPDEVYNLAGQTSVGLSFDQPIEALESISVATLNLLDALRALGRPVRFFNACSSECFGNTDGFSANEQTPFRPRSPYAIAKAAAYWQVSDYRAAYGLHAASGILFNHESPLRPETFVVRKIIRGAALIAKGEASSLTLGNLEISRDWGWAPEYVEAMWRMLQLPNADDFVIATGFSHPLKTILDLAFQYFGLDWERYVVTDSALGRPLDLKHSSGDPAKAEAKLGWRAKVGIAEIVKLIAESELHAQG